MPKNPDEYAGFVEHPRFGRRPRFTKLVPKVHDSEQFVIASRPMGRGRIDGTAIAANMDKQPRGGSYFIKYYFDEKRDCHDCGRPFIFFAEEQKYWFDELGLSLNAEGRRCHACRRTQNKLKRNNDRFAVLKNMESLSVDETMEMTDICLGQLEAGRFHPRQIQTVRKLIKRLIKLNDNESLGLEMYIEQTLDRILMFELSLTDAPDKDDAN